MSTTQEILHRLAASDGYDEAYVLRHQAPSFAEYLRQQLQARGISRAQLIRALCVERAYGYQLLNGTRRMSRTLLMRTALYLKMTVQDAQRLLRLGGAAALYARDRLDARVIFALEKGMSYEDAWLFIWGEEEKKHGDSGLPRGILCYRRKPMTEVNPCKHGIWGYCFFCCWRRRCRRR